MRIEAGDHLRAALPRTLIFLLLSLLLAIPASAQGPFSSRTRHLPVVASAALHRQPAQTKSDIRPLFHTCREVIRMRLPYRYGGEHPREGGMDCSGTVQWIFHNLGYTSIPRTADDQYRWLKGQRMVHKGRASDPKIWKRLRPGHLLFWGRRSWFSRRITHVMIYAGYDPKSGRHLAFGARGRSKTGINGAGVDFHPLDLDQGGKSKFIGYAALPGFEH